MRHIWHCGERGCLGAEMQEILSRERPLALTTVLTTLERLRDKGILAREREGKAYRYRAALSEEQLQQRIVEGVLGDLIAQFPKAVATYFTQQGLSAGDATADTPETLAALAKEFEQISRQKQAEPKSEDEGDHA